MTVSERARANSNKPAWILYAHAHNIHHTVNMYKKRYKIYVIAKQSYIRKTNTRIASHEDGQRYW